VVYCEPYNDRRSYDDHNEDSFADYKDSYWPNRNSFWQRVPRSTVFLSKDTDLKPEKSDVNPRIPVFEYTILKYFLKAKRQLEEELKQILEYNEEQELDSREKNLVEAQLEVDEAEKNLEFAKKRLELAKQKASGLGLYMDIKPGISPRTH